MANAPALGIQLLPELALNWFIVLAEADRTPDGRIDMKDIAIAAIAFYPRAEYRSPEGMLKAVRSLKDRGFLVPAPVPAETW